MFRTAVLATNKKCFPWNSRILLAHKTTVQPNICLSTSAADEVNDNPQNLPCLPVPDLKATLAKYLKTTKPFLNEDEYKCTEELLNNFMGPCGDGKRLQEYLLERAKTHTNWLEKWWLETAYLGYRDPVTIYSSPGQSFPFTTFESETDRLKYAASLIMAAVTYKQLIDKKKIPVDKMGKMELDMSQYEKIIGTCRIPALPNDKLQFHSKSQHIIVAHNNHFFKVVVMSEKGALLSKNQLNNQLKCCLTHSLEPGSGVGILTSEYRDNWAKAYKELMKDSKNKASVKEIQSALFLVCLDKPTCFSTDNRLTVGLRQFIHGGSSQINSANRWFDKTLQFVLSPFGEVGLTYEHSPSEGQPVAVMVDFLHNYIEKNLGADIPDLESCSDPARLEFTLNDELEDAMNSAEKNINKLACNLDMNCFKYQKYGKEFVKSQKLSPDSYIQMALQCAFYKIHQVPAAHYESAATRMYVGGRTETIRSCSCESIEFSKALLDPNIDIAKKVDALKKAIASHKKYTIEAVQGLGVDRHMLGLKLAANKLKLEVPAIFEDAGWKRSSYMRISSSQVATKCDGVMGYAPLVKDGYGCCYNPRADEMNFAVSAFADHPDTSATIFKTSLEWCLDEMQKILLKTNKSKM